jgi:hypothetical protein
MAEAKFTFPDEEGKDGPAKKVEADKLEIEIVDDTPPADKGKTPMPKEIVEELDHDDLEEYSEKVKLRMKQLKKVWHDERREKEAAARERDAAATYAKQKHEENQALRQRMGEGEKIFIKEVGDAAKSQLESARAKLKAAYEAGNADAITSASEALQSALIRQREIETFRPSRQTSEDGVQGDQLRQAPPPAPAPDPKAEAWKQKNGWFGSESDMTALALGLHEKLTKNGVNPTSDEYYREIDKTMKRRFPEYFQDIDPPEPPARTAATVVAPAARSTAPRKVTLTTTEVATAKRLGVSPEAYAREKIRLENQNG